MDFKAAAAAPTLCTGHQHRGWNTDHNTGLCEDAMTGLQLSIIPLTLLVLESCSFELHDTIHALIEENIHLHDQLESLTQGLKELKRMLWHHSNDPNYDHHDEDVQHLWEEWYQHSISAETRLMLEQSLCEHDLHDSVALLREGLTPLLLVLPCSSLLLPLINHL